MAKLRVYELAKELNMNSKRLIEVLNSLGAEAKNHMSVVEESAAEAVRKMMAPDKKDAVNSGGQLQLQQITEVKKEESSKGKAKEPSERKKESQKIASQKSVSKNETQIGKGHEKEKKSESFSNGNQKTQVKQLSAKPVEEELDFLHDEHSLVDVKRTKGNFQPIGAKPKHGKSRHKKAKKDEAKSGSQNSGLIDKVIYLQGPIVVKELAEKMGINPADVVKKLIALGEMATINQSISEDVAIIIASEFGFDVQAAPLEAQTGDLAPEVDMQEDDDPKDLVGRPPVVTVMGHVDHGKTSLLDAIRQTNVTLSEAGGITQHIGAYQVKWNNRKITFLDTPGHEAFTAMRARGAKVTDIAVLVVAADDGVMPQTIEAINHAKAAQVPIIVAINKIDKPDANPSRVMQELAEHNLVPESWGGDTICVEVSAKEKIGIDELLEMILLVADMQELKANPKRKARGTVIEAKLDKARGPVATLLIQNGTLKIGDPIVAGTCSGRVRAMVNDKGERVKEARPSMPVEVTGFTEVPHAGDIIIVCNDEREAKHIAEERLNKQKEADMKKTAKVTLDDLFHHIKEGTIKELNIVIKADVQGSAEAIKQSLEKLGNEEVRVNVIHQGVGAISETDVMLASASNAIIIGFNVRPDTNAIRLAETEKIDIRTYRIIYEALDDVKAAMEGLLEPDYKEVVLGRAEVRATFKVPKVGIIAGCYVTEGKVTRNGKARILRNGVVIFEGVVESLKRFKDDVREVVAGYECGIGIEKFNDIKEGDIIEVYIFEEVKKHL